MSDIKEAQIRLAFAEIEERQRRRNAARGRFILMAVSTVVLLAMAVSAQFARLQISGGQIIGLLVTFAIPAMWTGYRTDQELRNLRSEVERLKDEIGRK